jgi:tRNA A37 threonylcarbamoyladenosine biosynthesis protein TsaE
MYIEVQVFRVTSIMNVHDMTIEQILNVEVTSVEFGKKFAEDILQEQLAIHREMIGLYDNEKWQMLSDRHYDLRKIRHAVLHRTGKMAIEHKRATQR